MRRPNSQVPAPTSSAAEFLPPSRSLATLAEAAQHCRGCELYRNATQAVFGEGASRAKLFLVGEQPGDQEDLAGHPFVGPAGRVLDEVLEEVGISRDEVYVTNAVKHFKWTPRGKRRMHSKPSAREVTACRPWLEAELAIVHPEIVVCLGATAAQSLLGSAFRITRDRGRVLSSAWAEHILATYHPSALLRAPDRDSRRQLRTEFTQDLREAARWLRTA